MDALPDFEVIRPASVDWAITVDGSEISTANQNLDVMRASALPGSPG